MIDTPHIVRTAPQLAAVMRFTIPRAQIRKVMQEGINDLLSTLAEQGVKPAGPVFSHHLTMNPDTFDFEIGVPISQPIAPTSRVMQGELPARTVARTLYRGPYEHLGAAWGEFEAWLVANHHEPDQDLWECYTTNPAAVPDPALWETELNRPLKVP